MSMVMIYTDGACSGNPGPGGWGAILKCGGHTKEISGGEPSTTNNRMELTAATVNMWPTDFGWGGRANGEATAGKRPIKNPHLTATCGKNF